MDSHRTHSAGDAGWLRVGMPNRAGNRYGRLGPIEQRGRRRGPPDTAESDVAILCSDQSYECSLTTASVFLPIRMIFFRCDCVAREKGGHRSRSSVGGGVRSTCKRASGIERRREGRIRTMQFVAHTSNGTPSDSGCRETAGQHGRCASRAARPGCRAAECRRDRRRSRAPRRPRPRPSARRRRRPVPRSTSRARAPARCSECPMTSGSA